MEEAQRGESKRTRCVTKRECAARSRTMRMEEWLLQLEKLKSCWTEQRGLKPGVGGVRKREDASLAGSDSGTGGMRAKRMLGGTDLLLGPLASLG